MANSGRNTGMPGNGHPKQTGDDGTNETPLRPSVQYRPRGQGLDELPNADLIPSLKEPGKRAAPRMVSPQAESSGKSKVLIFGAIGAVVVVVGAFFALSGGDTPAPAPVVITTPQPPAPAPVAEAQPAPAAAAPVAVAEPVPAPVSPAPAAEPEVPGPAPVIAATSPSMNAAQPDNVPGQPASPTPAQPRQEGADAPALSALEPAPAPFVCTDCQTRVPELGNVAVVLHLGTGDDGSATMAVLRDLGVAEITTTPTAFPVSTSQVRYYRTEDIDAAKALAVQYGATLVDLTWYDPAPIAPTLDLWLAE